MSEKKCAICGTPIEVYRNRRYCSKECADKAAEEAKIRQLRERGGRTLGDIITCPTCGKNFLYSSARKKYCCVECKNNAQKMRMDEAAAPRPRRKPPMTISAIERAARDEGSSYGNYVLKYGI